MNQNTSQNQDLFTTQYNRLNTAQRRAVDTIEGPVMVFAGPGTGKTQILTLRIAHILRSTDVEADSILALTFTESGCANMRKRLTSFIGSDAYRVHIHTFHGLAAKIIADNPEMFQRMTSSCLATESDKLRIAETLLRAHTGRYIRWYDNFQSYVGTMLSCIDHLKREYITPEILQITVDTEQKEFDLIPDLIHEKGQYKGEMKGDYKKVQERIDKNQELVHLYRAYEAELRVQKLYDFTDILTEVVRVCETNKDFLQILQENYQYILVDEHQDTNNLQHRFVTLLSSFFDTPNLFVVGDDKQAVYRFQGASPEHFYGFADSFPDVKKISLEQNYRSVQSVLDTAHKLLPSDIVLNANKESEHATVGTVSVYLSESSESYGIAKSIKALVDSGIEPSEIAVLMRQNSDATDIALWLKRMNIQYRVEADIDVLQTPLVSSILQLITVFSDPTDSHTLSRVLYIPWIGLDPIDCAHIIKCFSGKRSHDKIYLIDILQNKKELESIGVKNTKDIMLFAQYISDCHRDFHSSEPTILFDTIVQHARFGPYVSLTGETIQESLSLIQVLYENIQSFISSNPNSHLSDYYTSLQTLIKHGKKLTQHIHAGAQGFVRIMTAHKSKGLEFDHVFIPYLVNKHWGNKTNSDSIKILDRVFGITESVDTNSDERRLLYVALTRARLQIHLSYSQTSDSAKEIAPSQFIAELPIENFTVVDTTAIHAEYESACLERYSTVVTASQSNKERFHQYIIELLDSRPLSATHLNNYLADPWQYIFQNLIRVPAMQNASMIYGTAVHRAIETAYTLQQTTGDVDIDSVFAQFRRVLDTSSLSEADHARLSVIGPELITNWISAHVSELKLYGYNELGIRGVIVPGIGLTLSGQIDRLEYINNSQTFVRVIDFKTGKTKTRTDVAGEIKSSDGNYYRQLCFYKLLLDNYRDGMYKMEQGSIAFIEPKSNGEYIEHTFVIPESDIVGLVETIAKMESDLRAGLYWDHIPDPKKCNFVDLVTRLQQ